MLPRASVFGMQCLMSQHAFRPFIDTWHAILLQGLQCLACLPESEAKESLKMMISYVLERLY